MTEFYTIAHELKLASNQVDAIRALLCIKEDTYIDGKTLKLYAPDLPQVFRDWIFCNKPEVVFFAGVINEREDNGQDFELLNY